MCGIAGIADFSGREIDKRKVEVMCDALRHRGPDEKGVYETAIAKGFLPAVSVVLGHRRLSIVDLKTEHQPIFNEDKSMKAEGIIAIIYGYY